MGTVLEGNISTKNPDKLFGIWLNEAKAACPPSIEVNAMCLSTATSTGLPSSRMVLLKAYGSEGYQFFTNYCSKKGSDIAENPEVSLLFFWPWIGRQVRIQGIASKMPAAAADAYWPCRPVASQASANISRQSQLVDSRETLEKRVEELLKLSPSTEDGSSVIVPRPEHWGGYSVVPREYEFYQSRTDWLDDRIIFRRASNVDGDQSLLVSGEDGWVYGRLEP